MKRKLKHDFDKASFDDENYLRQVIKNMAETEPKLLQEYDEGIDVAAKYCNTAHDSKPDSKPEDGFHGAGL